MTDIERYERLGARRKRLAAELAEIERELPALIAEAVLSGAVRQVDAVERTGYTREMIRRFCLPADEREALAARRRRRSAEE